MNSAFFLLAKVEMSRIARNRFFMIYSIVLPIVYYMILFYTNKQVNHAYLLVSMLLFSLLSGAVTTFAIGMASDNQQDWRKMMKVLPVSEALIIGARIFSQLMFNVVSILLLILFVHGIHRLPGTLWQWSIIVFWFIFVSIVFMTLGAAISSIGKHETVSGLANFTWIFIMITAGTWFPINDFPQSIQFFASVSPGALAVTGAFHLIEGNYQLTEQVIGLGFYVLFFIGIHFIIVKRSKREVFG